MKNLYLKNLILNNPVLVQSLGYVSVLAVSTTFKASIIMGIAVIIVMLLSSIVVSLLKKFIGEDFEVATLLVITAAFSYIIGELIYVIYPITAPSMGIYIPLIAVNSLILNRLQTKAIVSNLKETILDSITNGLGYLLVIAIFGFVRELLGVGSIMGLQIIPVEYTIPTFVDPMWAFILMGIFIAISNSVIRKIQLKGIK